MTNETEKLFYKDQYIKEFEGTVLEVTEKEDKFHVFLDKTAFFPGGGGQASDLGTLDGKEVEHRAADGSNGDKVMAKIERTKNATRNIFFGVILKIYNIAIPFLMRTAMIYLMGVQYLGLNSLFASILSVLNLAELGVGSAMVYRRINGIE